MTYDNSWKKMKHKMEDFYEEIINFLPDPTFAIDSDGVVIAWNHEMESFSGVPAEDMIGKGNNEYSVWIFGKPRKILIDYVLNQDPEILQKTYPRIRMKGQKIISESTMTLSDGSRRYLWITASPILDSHGLVIGAIESIRDVTHQKKSQIKMIESKKYATEIINSLPDPTYAIDIDGHVTAWNHEMESFSGVPAEDMIGKGDNEYSIWMYGKPRKSLIDYVLHQDMETLKNNYPQVHIEGQKIISESTMTLSDGSLLYFLVTASPILDSCGSVIGAVESIRDITHQKKTQNSLIESKKYLSDIFNFLPDATFVIDLEEKVIMWNRAMENITGVLHEHMLGKGDYEYAIPFYGTRKPMLANLILMPDEEVEKRYEQIHREGDTLIAEVFIPTFGNDGAFLWAKASPLYDTEGKIIGAVESVRDITNRIHAELEIRKTVNRLEQIINFLPDATFVIDLEGKVISWNKAMEDMTGIFSFQILGKGDFEYAIPFYNTRRPMLANLILWPDKEEESRYRSLIRDGDALISDFFLSTFGKDGTYIWAKATPIYDKEGEFFGVIESIRDISKRKLAEIESEDARTKLAEIINFLPDATLVIDAKGVVKAWNHAMELLSGIPASYMLGKGEYEYAIPFYGEQRPILANFVFKPASELESEYSQITREGDTLVVDTFLPRCGTDGCFVWAKATPLYDIYGNITGAIETIRDITDRRKMEERLARSKAELDIAAEIQRSFLPDCIPVIQGFDIAARSTMAKEVGGDFFDVIPMEVTPLEKGLFGILIADVSGKGVPAALFMVLSRIVIRINASWYSEPSKVINSANNIIVQDSKAGMFVTLFYGILSEKTRTMTYVNAGHNPPVVYRTESDRFEELSLTGLAMGAIEGETYTQDTIKINPNDIVVLYTDGVTESVNLSHEMFGEERLKSIIRKNKSLSADDLLHKIFDGVQVFSESMPQFDDITILVIKGR
jgi:PAS domain S-box-containing protein